MVRSGTLPAQKTVTEKLIARIRYQERRIGIRVPFDTQNVSDDALRAELTRLRQMGAHPACGDATPLMTGRKPIHDDARRDANRAQRSENLNDEERILELERLMGLEHCVLPDPDLIPERLDHLERKWIAHCREEVRDPYASMAVHSDSIDVVRSS